MNRIYVCKSSHHMLKQQHLLLGLGYKLDGDFRLKSEKDTIIVTHTSSFASLSLGFNVDEIHFDEHIEDEVEEIAKRRVIINKGRVYINDHKVIDYKEI